MNHQLRFGSLLTFVLAAAAALAACDSGDSTVACASPAECGVGQVCNAGMCTTPGVGQAGASGSGVGGSTAVAGSAAGGAAPIGGSGVVGGSAGSVATGGQPPGVAGSGGSLPQGGSAVGGAGGGSAGSSTGGGAMGGGGSGGGSGGSPTVVGECKDDFWPAANNGSVTRYDFNQGTQMPACTYVITHKGGGSDGDWDTVEGISTGDGGYFGAMNTTDYKQGAACGACVEASYNGRKVVLTIVDECPVSTNPLCQKGHIDLSRKAIRQLEPNGSLENLKGVSWKYVKCPANGNVKARLHPNQNANWQPVVVQNGLFPMQSVTINGKSATRTGNTQGGNAWVAEGQKIPYTVRATDVNGNTITFSYNDTGLKDVGQQFMCQ